MRVYDIKRRDVAYFHLSDNWDTVVVLGHARHLLSAAICLKQKMAHNLFYIEDSQTFIHANGCEKKTVSG